MAAGEARRGLQFHGGERANDSNKYFNRRAEVWGMMADWLKATAEIPNDPELRTDLTGYSAKQQIQLEKKEDMKARGLASPDLGDMLAMTFAVTVRAPAKQIPRAPLYTTPGDRSLNWMA